MYDVNPDIYGRYLSLNINDTESMLDFDVAIDAAPYYGIEKKDAEKMVDEIKDIVTNNWKNLASKYGVGRGEIERMKVAFV